MIINNNYEVFKKIKVHTKPDRFEIAVKKGRFVKETEKSYIFDKFIVSKYNFVEAREIQIHTL